MTAAATNTTNTIDAGKAIEGVENMIWVMARRDAGTTDEAELEDIVQNVRVKLWKRSIPKFDPSKNAKLTTYLHMCIVNAVREEARRHRRAKAGSSRTMPKAPTFTDIGEPIRFAADTSLDDRIEALAADIMHNPEKYLIPSQCRTLRAVLNAPVGTKMKDIAAHLGLEPRIQFQHSSSTDQGSNFAHRH